MVDNFRIRLAFAGIFLLGLATAGVPLRGAFGFTEQQVQKVFEILDADKTGKVDEAEYDQNKVAAMFWQAKAGSLGIGELKFEDTQFNRAFFDASDLDRKGTLDGVDMIYALQFEKIDVDRKGYITIDDLRRFMNKIGR
jgi:Ca2+-binding EF-hand superfamily protein